MNATFLTVAVTVSAAVVIAVFGARWHVVRDRRTLWAIVRNVLAERRYTSIGLAGALVYGVVYLVPGGRVVYFYERLLFNLTASGVLFAVLTAFLIAIVLALFAYTLDLWGLTQAKKGTWGIAGTLFAMVISFCP